MSNLVGMDEYDQHCYQADERHQHCCGQSCIDVWDKAPRKAMDRSISDWFCLGAFYKKVEKGKSDLKALF